MDQVMKQNHEDHSWTDPAVGQWVKVTGASGSSFAQSMEGLRGQVVKVIDQPDEDHDYESLPMFRVHMDNGMSPDPEFWCDEIELEEAHD